MRDEVATGPLSEAELDQLAHEALRTQPIQRVIELDPKAERLKRRDVRRFSPATRRLLDVLMP